jgi:hypothetical protein
LEESSATGEVEQPEAEVVQEPDSAGEAQPEPEEGEGLEEPAAVMADEASESEVSSEQSDAAPGEPEVAETLTVDSPELAGVEA